MQAFPGLQVERRGKDTLLVGALADQAALHGVKRGWTPHPLPKVERLAGKTMGLIGCGKIGSAVALRAQSFGLRLIAHDPFASSLPPGVVSSPSIHETLAASDIVSLHAPLTETTRHLLNERRLSHASARGDCHQRCPRWPSGSRCCGTSRQVGTSRGRRVDVAEVEPLPIDHPARYCPRVIVTPHIGYYSTTSVEEAKRRTVEEIVGVLAGRAPLHPVDIAQNSGSTR